MPTTTETDSGRKPLNPYLKPNPKGRPPPTDAALRRSAQRARERSDAVFIGVTGSSAKSSTTALLAHILSGHSRVELQLKMNSTRATHDKLSRLPKGAKLVVAELGVSSYDPYQHTTDVFQPDIAVVTMVQLEHRKRLATEEAVAAEKGRLVAALRPGGLAVLNADDPLVLGMAARTSERVVTFGQSENADYRVSDIGADYPNRLSLTVTRAGRSLRLKTRFVGAHHWLATLAAVSTALEFGMPAETVAKRVAGFEPLYDRCGAVETANGPNFIVDTAKMPWQSFQLAIDVVANATAPRKRIVLGPLSETKSEVTAAKYRQIYASAMAAADQVIFVGDHFPLSDADQADIDQGRFLLFEDARQVADHIRATVLPGELILVKGNARPHLERIALSWRHKVRCWHPECGIAFDCLDCGRYGFPFDWHQGHKRPGKLRRLANAMNLPWV